MTARALATGLVSLGQICGRMGFGGRPHFLALNQPFNWTRLLGVPLLLTATILIYHAFSPAAAQSPRTLTGECRSLFKGWQKKEGPGAFAASKSGVCGYASNDSSLVHARSLALSQCEKRSRGCKIIAENNSEPSACKGVGKTPQQWIDACSAIVAKSGTSKRTIAWAYSNRGLGYMDMGDLTAALADYDSAIKTDPEYAEAYFDRSELLEKRGEYAKSLADMRKFLKLWPLKDDKASSAKYHIKRIETRLRR